MSQFLEQDTSARHELARQAQTLLSVPIEEFTREKTLGWEVGFGEIKSEIEHIRTLVGQISGGETRGVPFEHVERLRSVLTDAQSALNSARNFTVGGRSQNPSAERRDIIESIRKAAQRLFLEVTPVLASTIRSEEVAKYAETELARVIGIRQATFDDQVKAFEESRLQVDQLRTEVSETLEASKAAAEDAGIAAQSTYFQTQAEEHRKGGTGWLVASVALLLAVVGLASFSVDHYLKNPPAADTPANIQLIAAKVVLFSALFAGLIAATRSYRAHRHNYVVNKHRQNALLTFRAFSQQANADPATKNAVLLQATQCIFSPQVTGYSSQDAESGYPPILEVVRTMASPEKGR